MSRLADILTGMDRGAGPRVQEGSIPGLAPQPDLAPRPAPQRRWWRVIVPLVILGGMAALAAAFAFRSPDTPPAPLPVVTPVRPAAARPVPPVPLREVLRQARGATQSGSLVEAAILFRQALEIDDRDAETWNNLGVVLVFQGQSSEGIDAFRRAVRLAPRHAEANRNLAVALDREGKTTAAIAHYRVFLTNAAVRHPARESVSQRLADLGGSVAGASSEAGVDTESRRARRGQAR